MVKDPLDFLNDPDARRPQPPQPPPPIPFGHGGPPKASPRPPKVNPTVVSIIVAAVAVAVFGIVIIVFLAQSSTSPNGSTPSAIGRVGSASGPAIKMDILDFTDSNRLEFERKYIGKLVEISVGIGYNRTGRAADGSPAYYLDSGLGWKVECRFAESEIDRLAALDAHAPITIRGICREQGHQGVLAGAGGGLLDNCSIVSVGKAPPGDPFTNGVFGPSEHSGAGPSLNPSDQ